MSSFENQLKLIKDLDNFKFVYYWACPFRGKVSPEMPTLLHAGEWMIEYQTANYEGRERRKTMIDRRKKELKPRTTDEKLQFVKRTRPEGRRITDKMPDVDLDLSEEKLKEMKQSILN